MQIRGDDRLANTETSPTPRTVRALLPIAALAVAACAPLPPSQPVRYQVPPPPRPATEVYFYPNAGQSAAQQDRDRYECYLWAVQQSGFDPSQPQLAPHQRVEVIPAPPAGQETAAGAVIGAALGAAVSRPRDSFQGAVTGAIAGALVGAAAEGARQEQAAQARERYDLYSTQHTARLERQARDYRRAMAACLEGRGYTVR